MNKNTIKKAQIVQNLVKTHWQPGRHDRCKLWVFRCVIVEKMPMSQSTFFRYLRIIRQEQEKNNQKSQLQINFPDAPPAL